jgi:hypothetical protein
VNGDLAERLTCAGCGREQAVDERGWRAYLTDEEPAQTLVCCPDCATRELGRRGACGSS